MANYEDVLREKTFKVEGEDTERRVYNTLSDGLNRRLGGSSPVQLEMWIHKVSKTLALLISHLEKDGLLRPEKLDEILFAAIQ